MEKINKYWLIGLVCFAIGLGVGLMLGSLSTTYSDQSLAYLYKNLTEQCLEGWNESIQGWAECEIELNKGNDTWWNSTWK